MHTCDNEVAIKALREELMRRAGTGAVPEEPPVAESASTARNGIAENGVKLQRGMLRVHLTSLGQILGATIPAARLVLGLAGGVR